MKELNSENDIFCYIVDVIINMNIHLNDKDVIEVTVIAYVYF